MVVAKVVSEVVKEHGLTIRGYTDFERMLAGEELDAVAVQVDPDKQVPLACRAMEAGCHVMMEVPVA
ncbi:MAG: Gfo/Idh/MocA family oxidoreductase, partial [Coprothermobacterota bacterium]|nr:Gfo/Idh/MocA family oxidoreductase [Coprothermobacterota bacterium]